jgi:hypothetical protein
LNDEPCFRLAVPADEPALRELCAVPIPGDWIDLSFQREPDFASGLHSPEDQVLVGLASEQLVAVAVRSLRTVYVDGQPCAVDFLHSLRVRPGYQGQFLLWRGFRLLQGLGVRAPMSFATISEGNATAEEVLVRKRRSHWPRFEFQSRLWTLALEVGRSYPLRGQETDAAPPQLDWGRARQFFPVGLSQAHERRRWLVTDRGVAALRDARPSRQTVVAQYRRPLSQLRLVFNGWARLCGRPGLPAVGQSLAGAYAGYWCLAPGARDCDFRDLLEGLLELARRDGLHWLYLGLLEDDPWLALARTYRHRAYHSRLYRVGEGGPAFCPHYLELADL